MSLKSKMFVPLLISCLFSFYESRADKSQPILKYQAIMNLFDSCFYHDLSNYDTLYEVTVVETSYGENYKNTYFGWVSKWDTTNIVLLTSLREELKIEKKTIYGIKSLSITETTMAPFWTKDEEMSSFSNYNKNYLISLWLHKKGFDDFSKKILLVDSSRLSYQYIVNDFAFRYYDIMLGSLCSDRNYNGAIRYGNHLSKEMFKKYEYRRDIIGLTKDLKTRPNDFKAFHLPDSTEWASIKSKLNREEQIKFLCDRLKLLNCIQPGQPADISYNMLQYSVSYDESKILNFSYWDYNSKYTVVNPYNELIAMKLNPKEMELILPYLLNDNYIPTFTYFRSFMRDRRIHKLNAVIYSLIYQIANRRFFIYTKFDTMGIERKKTEVEKIRRWCEENSNLSPEQSVLRIMNKTDNWTDFSKALSIAKELKSNAIVPIIERRFNDFSDKYSWPGPKGQMAETIYQLGNEKDIVFMSKWNDTTKDDWVHLWTSMFLVKYDKAHYEEAMNKLELVLKQCDGVTYYPHAMDLLLSLNDPHAMKLAQNIINKTQFQQWIFSDYYLDFVKKLLLKKNEHTYQFMYERLTGAYVETDTNVLNNGPEMASFLTENMVWAVETLRYGAIKYNRDRTPEEKKEYSNQLADWFKTQYNLLKMDKPNELILTIKQVNAQ